MPAEISSDSRKKLSRLIATINQWPELEINGLLDDCKDDSTKILELVLTLKHYANPLGNGYPKFSYVEEDLQNILLCLEDPSKLPKEKNLTLDDQEKEYLVEIIRLALDKRANEIIAEKKITQEDIQKAILNNIQISQPMPSAPPATFLSTPAFEPPTPSAPPLTEEDKQNILVERWWNNLTAAEQQKVKQRYESLNQEQVQHLQQRTTYYSYYSARNKDLFHYHQMCLIDAELNYFTLRAVVDVSAIVLRGVVYGAIAAGRIGMMVGNSWGRSHSRFGGHGSSVLSGESETVSKLKLAAGIIALASAAIIGAIYALKKVYNSFRNIFHGEKILRSIFRLATTGGGTYLGILAGGILGGMAGSAFPVLGTAAGVILGMIFGAGVGAGLGSLFGKYFSKFVSKIIYKDELNPTNPDKWRLSKKQKALMQYHGINIAKVEDEIVDIKNKKQSIGFKGSFFWRKEREEKNKLNRQLEAIKNGKNILKQYPPIYSFFSPVPNTFEYSETYTTTRRVGVR